MAAAGPSTNPPPESTTAPRDMTNVSRQDPQTLPSSTPMEMSHLSSKSGSIPEVTQNSTSTQSSNGAAPLISDAAKENNVHESTSPTYSSIINPSSASETYPAHPTRSYSTAIGPSSDQPMPVPKDENAGPILMITLLLTTGARHPFKLDSKYLARRNVEVQGNDPFNLSVYKLKELILREWREGNAPGTPRRVSNFSDG